MQRPWQIQRGAPLAAEVARLIHEACLDVASSANDSPEDAVHGIRRSTRRLRALARLVRSAVGDRAFEDWNGGLRDQARRLAPARDAEVLRTTLSTLAEGPSQDAKRLGRFVARVAAAADETHRALRESGTLWDVAHTVAELEPAMAAVVPPRVKPGEIVEGAEDAYRRARDHFDAAKARPEASMLHEWRKRAKVVRVHAECLPLSDARGKTFARVAKELVDLLGEHHDMEICVAWIEGSLKAVSPGDEPLLHELAGRAALRQRSLEPRVFAVGAEVFDERPADLARRVRAALGVGS